VLVFKVTTIFDLIKLPAGEHTAQRAYTGSYLHAAELADFHPDPADRFIAATSMGRAATLITADQAMLRWPGPLRCHSAGT